MQFRDVCNRSVAVSLPRWRTYLYDDADDEPIVGHMNGSNSQAFEELVQQCVKHGTDASKVKGRLGRLQDE